jgi:hypothetical protein
MPTQNLISVDNATDRAEVLHRQPSKRIMPVVYDTSTKGLYARDNKNSLDLTLIGGPDFPINSSGVAGLAPDLLQRQTLTITSAQLKALFATPVTLLAAPGAGLAILINSAFWNFIFGTVQYTLGGAIQLQYTGQSVNLLNTTLAAADVLAAVNAQKFMGMATTASGIVVKNNTGIDVQCATQNFATGDGVLNVTIEYKVVASL